MYYRYLLAEHLNLLFPLCFLDCRTRPIRHQWRNKALVFLECTFPPHHHVSSDKSKTKQCQLNRRKSNLYNAKRPFEHFAYFVNRYPLSSVWARTYGRGAREGVVSVLQFEGTAVESQTYDNLARRNSGHYPFLCQFVLEKEYMERHDIYNKWHAYSNVSCAIKLLSLTRVIVNGGFDFLIILKYVIELGIWAQKQGIH